jgi:hypothetical protein
MGIAAVRGADRDDQFGVARIGDADGPVARAHALLLRRAAVLEAGVARSRHDDRPVADQVIAGLADRRLAAGEAVDVMGERQRKIDAVHHRNGAVAVQPADELDGGEDGEFVALAIAVEDAKVV